MEVELFSEKLVHTYKTTRHQFSVYNKTLPPSAQYLVPEPSK
jgi:hypothetical protein